MELIEKQGNLFKTECKYLMHCISADYAMGAGIAVEFKKRFGLIGTLSNYNSHPGDCILVKNVFNLITKRNYWNKPTYNAFRNSLLAMKEIALEKNITEIAGPKIGCGLDKLKWPTVKQILEEVFKDTDITIIIYTL